MERIKEAMQRARAAAQGRTRTGRPVAGTVAPEEPAISYSQTRVVQIDPRHLRRQRLLTGSGDGPAEPAYKILRTQVLQRLAANGWNALAVTSPGPGQGKSLTAANLAISLAREVHYTVLLVDLDLRKPALHRLFGISPQAGIGDCLTRGTPLSEALVNPSIERLVLLPGREPLGNSSELLASPRMAQLVDELKNRYPSRIVIFDLPPLLAADDTLAFSPYVDAALLVVEEGGTPREDVEQALQLLKQTRLLGTVLNKASLQRPAYA
ncbi:MAG: polysaccharide biosynthesis tyrosine autokinase [Gammaproteobacteria bacterium]|nr:MAG: polysaccharide biosynthesis tyrosine autokinase [Gammaproteobacteria bacterium]